MAVATERERELAALKVTLEEREAQLEEVKHSLRLTDDGQVGVRRWRGGGTRHMGPVLSMYA